MCEGSKITYRIQIDDMLLPGFFSSRGNVPVNITVAADIVNHLRIGCQHLIIYASKVAKVLGVFTHLQVLESHNLRAISPSGRPNTNVTPLFCYFSTFYIDLCAGENKGTSSCGFGRQGGKSKTGKYRYWCFP